MKIGILAIQGSVIEHRQMLEKIGVEVKEIRLPEDIENIAGIILPGGESTTQSKLLKQFGLFDLLQNKIREGLPVWGTCAGAILLAKKVEGKNIPDTLRVMDIVANRNWYGGQRDSFVCEVDVSFFEEKTSEEISNFQFPISKVEAVFIRAPKLDALTDDVKILAIHDNQPIMLRQKNMLVTAFHPELTDDTRVHEYFAKEICRTQKLQSDAEQLSQLAFKDIPSEFE